MTPNPTITVVLYHPTIANLSIEGSYLTPGINYTPELPYGFIASPPKGSYLNAVNFQGVAVLNTTTRVTLAVAGDSDFDGDQSSDTLWRNSNNGATVSNTSVRTIQDFGRDGSGGAYIGTGNFDGDGKTNALWRNSSNGPLPHRLQWHD